MAIIKLKHSTRPSKVPLPAQLTIGEVALNAADGEMYTKKTDGSIKRISNDFGPNDRNKLEAVADTSLIDYGLMDGGNITSVVQNAVDAAEGGHVTGPTGVIEIAELNNPLGTTFDNKIQIVINGRLYNSYSRDEMVWGEETLFGLFNKLRNRQNIKIVFTGDSTTAGWGLNDEAIDRIVFRAAANAGIRGVTTVNRGFPAKDTNDWDTTYVAGDIAENPDVFVIRWGLNDPYYGRTMLQFSQSLRSGLTKIRTAYPLSSGVSILLMSPNTANTPNHIDPKWLEYAQKVVRQAAYDFNCAFIDTYGLYQNAYDGGEKWLDEYCLHPTEPFNWLIGNKIAEVLFPKALVDEVSRQEGAVTTLLNGWGTTVLYPMEPMSAVRDKNIIMLNGALSTGTRTWGTHFATVPVWARPKEHTILNATLQYNGGFSFASVHFSIDILGQALLLSGSDPDMDGILHFSGISYTAAMPS